MNKLTQKDMILRYLNEKGSITTLEAFTELYICDLQKNIQILRETYDIKDEWIHKKNYYGKPIKYKRYYLDGFSQWIRKNARPT